jgi:hypothetical protein
MANRLSVAVGDRDTIRPGFRARTTEPLPASTVTGNPAAAGAAVVGAADVGAADVGAALGEAVVEL